MITMTAREANQQFSRLLQQAEAGEDVVITRRGKPVVKIVRLGDSKEEAERRRRVEELIAHLEAGALHGGRQVDWTRDELYDRSNDDERW